VIGKARLSAAGQAPLFGEVLATRSHVELAFSVTTRLATGDYALTIAVKHRKHVRRTSETVTVG